MTGLAIQIFCLIIGISFILNGTDDGLIAIEMRKGFRSGKSAESAESVFTQSLSIRTVHCIGEFLTPSFLVTALCRISTKLKLAPSELHKAEA
jgi:hypothetical protein